MKQPAQQHQEWAQQQHQAAVKRHQEFAQQQAAQAAAQSQAQTQRLQQMQRDQFQRMQQAVWQQQRQQEAMRVQKAQQPYDPFGRAERALDALHQKVALGEIAADQLLSQLDELTVQDDQGRHWALGVDNRVWYRFDPARRIWTPGAPPRLASAAAPRPASFTPADTHPFRALFAFLAALAVTAALGFVVGSLSYSLLPESWATVGSMLCAVVVWLLGLVRAWRWAQDVYDA